MWVNTIEVYVKDLDTENKKVSLLQLRTIPGRNSKPSIPLAKRVHGSGCFITKFGARRILPGVDGLVHISEISRERVEKFP